MQLLLQHPGLIGVTVPIFVQQPKEFEGQEFPSGKQRPAQSGVPGGHPDGMEEVKPKLIPALMPRDTADVIPHPIPAQSMQPLMHSSAVSQTPFPQIPGTTAEETPPHPGVPATQPFNFDVSLSKCDCKSMIPMTNPKAMPMPSLERDREKRMGGTLNYGLLMHPLQGSADAPTLLFFRLSHRIFSAQFLQKNNFIRRHIDRARSGRSIVRDNSVPDPRCTAADKDSGYCCSRLSDRDSRTPKSLRIR